MSESATWQVEPYLQHLTPLFDAKHGTDATLLWNQGLTAVSVVNILVWCVIMARGRHVAAAGHQGTQQGGASIFCIPHTRRMSLKYSAIVYTRSVHVRWRRVRLCRTCIVSCVVEKNYFFISPFIYTFILDSPSLLPSHHIFVIQACRGIGRGTGCVRGRVACMCLPVPCALSGPAWTATACVSGTTPSLLHWCVM